MNYILFREDGSIKQTNFTDVINQNSDGVNKIFVSVEGLDIESHSAVGVFVLPDQSASVEVGEPETDFEYKGEGGPVADGYVITLTQSETALAGLVRLTIQVKQTSTQKTLYTFRVPLTINATADLETYVNITLAQYNNLLDYINTFSPTNLVPYTGATDNVNLGDHSIRADSFLSQGMIFNPNSGLTFYEGNTTLSSDEDIYLVPGDSNYVIYGGYEIANKNNLPKKGLCASFSTGDFTAQSGGHYAVSDVTVSDFIAGSDMLVITWDNCFALCPIPQSGAGRVVAALWSADGESRIVRVRYELKDNNTKLDISLSSGFTPPSNHTAYVFCYKLID